MAGGIVAVTTACSDTTIMASAGAGCNHISHVEHNCHMHLPYWLSHHFLHVVVGFTKSAIPGLIVGVVLLFLFLNMMKKRQARMNMVVTPKRRNIALRDIETSKKKFCKPGLPRSSGFLR